MDNISSLLLSTLYSINNITYHQLLKKILILLLRKQHLITLYLYIF